MIKKSIVFLGMGGTIAGTAATGSDNVGYVAAQLRVEALLQGIPGFKSALRGHDLNSEQVVQVDSKDMCWSDWQKLYFRALHHLQQDAVKGLVITHGTDTLEETAYFLSRVLPADLLAVKPVIFTCAMRPFSSDFPDGPQNLRDATVVAVESGVFGVLVVCAGKVHLASEVQKIFPYQIDPFSSGSNSPVGYVEEECVRWIRPLAITGTLECEAFDIVRAPKIWPRVEIVMNFVGANGGLVRLLCRASADQPDPIQGIVVAGTGNGTMSADMETAIEAARNLGIRVIVSTRCEGGPIVRSKDCLHLDKSYLGLPIVKARIALVLDLLRQDKMSDGKVVL